MSCCSSLMAIWERSTEPDETSALIMTHMSPVVYMHRWCPIHSLDLCYLQLKNTLYCAMGNLLDSRIYDLFGRLENARKPLAQLVTTCRERGDNAGSWKSAEGQSQGLHPLRTGLCETHSLLDDLVYVLTLRLHEPNGLFAHLSYMLALILQTCPASHCTKHRGRLLHHCVCVSAHIKRRKSHRKFSGLLRAYGNTVDGSLCVVFRSRKEKEGSGIKQLRVSEEEYW